MGKKAAFALVALFIASFFLLGTPAAKAQMPPFSSQLPASVHILADGSVDPPNASVIRAGDVYTLTGDVGVSIVVDKDNVTVDGAGHTLWGNFSGGVHLDGSLGVTVKNLTVKDAGYAFDLTNAADCRFVGNTINGAMRGFFFFVSWRNTIENNTLTNIGFSALDLFGPAATATSQHNTIINNKILNAGTGLNIGQPNNVFTNNTVTSSYVGVYLSGDGSVLRNNAVSNNHVNFEVSSFNNDVDQSNTVDDNPIVYWVGHHDETVPTNAGYVALVDCDNVKAQRLNVQGISVVSTSNSLVAGNKVTHNGIPWATLSPYVSPLLPDADYGIQLQESRNVNVTGNSVSGTDYGMKLTNCTGTRIVGNDIKENTYYGLMLTRSDDNVVEGNNIIANGFVTGIVTQGDAFGVSISDSSNNRFVGNNVKDNNFWGIRVLGNQHDNVIFHNNFIDNQVHDGGLQVSMLGPANPSTWDNGKEGNYWSDYTTRYPNASEIPGTGVGNTPFFINENNQDNYPLMAPYDISGYAQQSPFPSSSANPTPSPSPSPSLSPTASATPQTSGSPTASPSASASEQPATSPEPNATLIMPLELLFEVAAATVSIAVVAVLVFARRRHLRN